jgi:transcription initiation factor TFIIH subunit 2
VLAEGDASLQNTLDLAVEQLASVPPYGHRQVIMLVAALSSVDPGDVYASIAKCKEAKIT